MVESVGTRGGVVVCKTPVKVCKTPVKDGSLALLNHPHVSLFAHKSGCVNAKPSLTVCRVCVCRMWCVCVCALVEPFLRSWWLGLFTLIIWLSWTCTAPTATLESRTCGVCVCCVHVYVYGVCVFPVRCVRVYDM
jgi:hypothetical protein